MSRSGSGATIADAVREGYRRNLPLRQVADAEREIEPLFTVSDPAIVIEAVKLAEDGSGDVIVRAYESTGARVRGRITPTFAVSSIVETDLLERPIVRRWTDRGRGGRRARAPTVPADHPAVWSLGLNGRYLRAKRPSAGRKVGVLRATTAAIAPLSRAGAPRVILVTWRTTWCCRGRLL